MEPDKVNERADPSTRLLARRVVELRKSIGLTQADLGAEMAKRRPNWSRSTVAKLEKNLRESVPVADLLALAVVLGVPPAWLIADPTGEQSTPVADGLDIDGWSAILWFTGQRALRNQPDHRWAAASEPIRTVLQIQALAERVEGQIRLRETDPRYIAPEDAEPVDAKAAEQADRPLVERLVPQLKWLAEHGFSAPPLPEAVAKRARELGVALPGVGD